MVLADIADTGELLNCRSLGIFPTTLGLFDIGDVEVLVVVAVTSEVFLVVVEVFVEFLLIVVNPPLFVGVMAPPLLVWGFLLYTKYQYATPPRIASNIIININFNFVVMLFFAI